jgi:hypothetical protein
VDRIACPWLIQRVVEPQPESRGLLAAIARGFSLAYCFGVSGAGLATSAPSSRHVSVRGDELSHRLDSVCVGRGRDHA